MDLKYAKLNARATCGDSFLLTEVSPVYNYVNGQRSGGPVAYNYTVVLPMRKFVPLRVRIEGDCRMQASDDPINVKLDNLQLEIKWNASEGKHIAGTATNISPVTTT